MIDQAIARLASRQHGLFWIRQVYELGGHSKLIERRLGAGRWTHEADGVYGLPGWPDSWWRDIWRGFLATGPHSVVSHESAATVHRLHPFPRWGRLELSAPHGDHHRPSSVFVHQPRDLREHHIIEVAGLRVTTIPRTFCDLAEHAHRRRLAQSIDQAHVDRKSSVDDLDAVFQELRRPGKRGFKMLDSILEVRRRGFEVPESKLERMLRQLIRDVGIPEPEYQAALPWLPDLPQRLDVLWRPARLIVEADGRSWHVRMDQMAADRKRDRTAQQHGHRLFRYPYEEIRYERRSVAAELLEALKLVA